VTARQKAIEHFDRKVHRRILDPVYDIKKENWRILTNKEIYAIVKKTYSNRDNNSTKITSRNNVCLINLGTDIAAFSTRFISGVLETDMRAQKTTTQLRNDKIYTRVKILFQSK
jgi:hypothetical protein